MSPFNTWVLGAFGFVVLDNFTRGYGSPNKLVLGVTGRKQEQQMSLRAGDPQPSCRKVQKSRPFGEDRESAWLGLVYLCCH